MVSVFILYIMINYCRAGKNNIFRDNDGYNRPSQSQNENNFPTFSLGLEFLNEAEKEKNNGKGDSASAPSRFASLHLIFRLPRTITSDIVVRFSRRI